jgi:hypothetical protein
MSTEIEKKECQLLKGLPANKKGWRWVYTKPFGTVPSGAWFCNDYSTCCEICRGKELKK